MAAKKRKTEDVTEAELPKSMTADQILEELALIGSSDLRFFNVEIQDNHLALVSIPSAPANAWRAVQSIKRKQFFDTNGILTKGEIEVKMWDKMSALRMLGQHLGMFAGDASDEPLVSSKIYQLRVVPQDPEDGEDE